MDGLDVGQRHLFAQFEGQADGRLGVDLGRVALNDGLGDAEGVVIAPVAAQREIGDLNRLAHGLFPESVLAVEGLVWSAHALRGQHSGEDGGASGGGAGAALPHGEFSLAGYGQGQRRRDGQGNGVAHLLVIQAQYLAGPTGGADDAEHTLVPAQVSGHHLVGQPAEDLIGQCDGRYDGVSVSDHGVGHGQHGWNHIAGVPTPGREIGVVAVQVPDHHSVGEPGHVGRRELVGTQDTRRGGAGDR